MFHIVNYPFVLLIFVAFLTFWGDKHLKQSYKKKIEISYSPKEMVSLRNAYRFYKIILLTVYTLIIVPLLYFSLKDISITMRFPVGPWPFVASLLSILLPYASSLPVSCLTIDDFKKEDFALFLRGFSHDSYDSSKVWKIIRILGPIENQNKLPFSEEKFAKVVYRFMPIFCVGITRELESPKGAKRIYLSDVTWKKDVTLLIKKAKFIFILINPSDSCIWEIEQCQKIDPNKVFYFVDDMDKLNNVKNKMGETTPQCIKNVSNSESINYINKGKTHSLPYTNTKKGFKKLLKKVFLEKDVKIYTARFFFSMNWNIPIFLLSLGVIYLFVDDIVFITLLLIIGGLIFFVLKS